MVSKYHNPANPRSGDYSMPSIALRDCPPVLYVRGKGENPPEFPHLSIKMDRGKPRIRSKRPWYMVLVKPNRDRTFARVCQELGVTYFLPMKPCTVKKAGKSVKGMRVLFPGYVFFRGNALDFYEVKKKRKHLRIVKLPDQIGVHRQLEQLYNALEWCLGKLETTFPLGHEVAIISGKLEGLKARVIAHHPEDATVRVAVRLMWGDAVFRIPADNLAGLPHVKAS